jgi:serine/threonine protein kinase
MDYSERLAISYYDTIANLNEEHKVYLVQHKENKKIFVKKVLNIYNPHIYEYLQSHSITGIPKLYNMYEENGQLTIIEEFISGTSLQELIDTNALSVDLIIQFVCELCDILEKLHFLNPPIIHRDIKPSNIIITSYNHVVLVDFNAAKYLTNPSSSDTVLLGTKGYAAPEQYGFGSSTPQTDIYALGILLKELSSVLPLSTNIFDSIINKCTQINPADRMKDVHELKTEIEKIKGNNTAKQPLSKSTTWKDFVPPGFRTKTPWKILTASIIYLLIFWLCLSLEVKDVTIFQLWIERIICLLIMLSIVFCCFNYCNIQRFMPLCMNRHRIVRYFGILLLNVLITVSLFIIMLMLVTLF